MSSKPKLFVGSSAEANAKGALTLLVKNLSDQLPQLEIVPWTKSTWKNLKTALDSLSESIVEYSYAVFLAFPDDVTTIRGENYYTARDNVIFEFGLFFSHLGPERTFLIASEGPLPSKEPLRILTDVTGGFRAGSYVLKSMSLKPVSIRYKLGDLISKIKVLEKDRINRNAEAALRNLDRQAKKLSADILEVGKVDSYYSGKIRSAVEPLMLNRAKASEKSLCDVAKDILLYFESVPDLCDVQQLAATQSYKKGIKAVWVFADLPMEFLGVSDPAFTKLRTSVVENLEHGVKYIYFVSPKFHSSSIQNFGKGTNITKARLKRIRKNISVVVVDARLFKTFFTLHFVHDGLQSVYMSSVMKSRRDLLIQVSDPDHTARIYSCIRALGQNVSLHDEVEMLDLVIV